jgi:aarF domain-containing kinase
MQKENSEQYKERMEALREDQGVQKGQKLRNPVDAWPAELVFFGRVTNMLKGLCSRLDVAHPYLNTMANAARQTLREAVPIDDRADRLIHSSADTIDTPLQRRLIDAVHQLQDQDEMVGLQVCVLSQGKELANIAGGVLGTANPRPVTPSTLFCVFSVSKALLSIGMLRLVQEKRIALDDPVVHYWPAFAENGKNEVTIRHVLTHQAGLANALPDDASLDVLLDWERMKGVIEKAIPDHKPGERTMYHYLTYAWICGGIIEQVTGAPYEDYLSNILKVPLRNLDNNLFLAGIPKDANPEALAVLSMERRQESKGAAQTADSSSNKAPGKAEEGKKVLQKYRGREQLMNPSVFNMRRVREAKLPSANGHASAAALAAVFDSLLQAKSPLLEDTILEAARHHNMQVSPLDEALLLDNSGASFGLGFQLHEFDMEGGNKATAFGHSGIGGSIVLSLPEANLTVAIVTNRLSQNSKVRQTLLDIVLDDFGLEVPQSLQGS